MIDWVIILLHDGLLFCAMLVLIVTADHVHPVKGQFIRFFTLTLPVTILFALVLQPVSESLIQ